MAQGKGVRGRLPRNPPAPQRYERGKPADCLIPEAFDCSEFRIREDVPVPRPVVGYACRLIARKKAAGNKLGRACDVDLDGMVKEALEPLELLFVKRFRIRDPRHGHDGGKLRVRLPAERKCRGQHRQQGKGSKEPGADPAQFRLPQAWAAWAAWAVGTA